MSTILEILKRISERENTRKVLVEYIKNDPYGLHSNICRDRCEIMACEILDDYLEQALQHQKTIEGILKDIQGDVGRLADKMPGTGT